MKKKIVVICVALLLIGSSIIAFISISKNKKDQEISLLEYQINKHIEDLNYCTSEIDCFISSDVSTCPFGCNNLINRNADLSIVKNEMKNYYALSHDLCQVQCTFPPKEIKCINKKCVFGAY